MIDLNPESEGGRAQNSLILIEDEPEGRTPECPIVVDAQSEQRLLSSGNTRNMNERKHGSAGFRYVFSNIFMVWHLLMSRLCSKRKRRPRHIITIYDSESDGGDVSKAKNKRAKTSKSDSDVSFE